MDKSLHPILQILHHSKQNVNVIMAPVTRMGTRIEPQIIILIFPRGDVGCLRKGLKLGNVAVPLLALADMTSILRFFLLFL